VPEPKPLGDDAMSWNLIKLDETPWWHEDVRRDAQTCWGVYAFDDESRTYCCSANPTFEMHFIAHSIDPKPGLPEPALEALNEAESSGNSEAVTYISYYDVKERMRTDASCWQAVEGLDEDDLADDRATVDAIHEGWHAGSLTF